jgi:hypothetical protein
LEEPVQPFHLPFEFNNNDRLGPWDVLISEDTIESMQQLEVNIVKAAMKKLGHISSGEWGKHELQCLAWDKHELRRAVQTHTIPVYEIELSDSGLRILWSIDYGFSIRSFTHTQLVKVWAVTTDQEEIHKTLENLSIFYTARKTDRCTAKQIGKDNVYLPIDFEDEEEKNPSEPSVPGTYVDKLEVHKMLTNKFVPLSKVMCS